MIRLVLKTLLSHWRRAPLQLFALVAGLALATALWSGVQAINAEARASYDMRYRQIVSFFGDLRILMQTVRVVLRGTGY